MRDPDRKSGKFAAHYLGKIKLPRLFLANVGWSAFSALITTLALQLMVFPLLGRELPTAEFASLLTALAMINIVGQVCGGAISNLVMRDHGQQCDQSGYSSNSATLNTCFAFVAVLGVAGLTAVMTVLGMHAVALSCAVSFAMALRTYLTSEYRLRLEYRWLATSNFALAVGYGLGLGAYYLDPRLSPLIVLAAGELLAVSLLAAQSKLLTAGLSLSRDAIVLLKQLVGFIVSGGATNVLSYGDRLVLSRTSSLAAVPVFFVAALGGRLAQLVMNVLSGVLLSYLVRARIGDIRSSLPLLLAVSFLSGIATWAFIVVVMPFILDVLYPVYAKDAKSILTMVGLGFAAKIVEVMLRPMVIRGVRVGLLATVDVISVACYLGIGLWFVQSDGLNGFSIVFAVVMCVKCLANMALLIPAYGQQNVRW